MKLMQLIDERDRPIVLDADTMCFFRRFAPGRLESETLNWGGLVQNCSLMQTHATAVRTETVDEIVRDSVSFHPKALRMDVEGAELMVLDGSTRGARAIQTMPLH
jgi:FkbM family methyltransferase